MKEFENTLQDLKCMLIEDGYIDDNIVMRTLIKAQQQVKNLNIPAVRRSVVWKPTNQLRWYKRMIDEGSYKRILQQLWLGDLGEEDWIDVPEVG